MTAYKLNDNADMFELPKVPEHLKTADEKRADLKKKQAELDDLKTKGKRPPPPPQGPINHFLGAHCVEEGTLAEVTRAFSLKSGDERLLAVRVNGHDLFGRDIRHILDHPSFKALACPTDHP